MLRKMVVLMALLAALAGAGRLAAQISTASALPGREIQLGLRWAF